MATNPKAQEVNVMLVPVRTGTGDGGDLPTAPPAKPWWLGVVRAWWTFLPALLWVGDYLVSRLTEGAYQIPALGPFSASEVKLFVSVALPALLGYLKKLKEQGRQDDAAMLVARGVPVGQVIDPKNARGIRTGTGS